MRMRNEGRADEGGVGRMLRLAGLQRLQQVVGREHRVSSRANKNLLTDYSSSKACIHRE